MSVNWERGAERVDLLELIVICDPFFIMTVLWCTLFNENSLCEELWTCGLKFNIAEIVKKLRAFANFILVAEIKKKYSNVIMINGYKFSLRNEENYINRVFRLLTIDALFSEYD